MLIDSTRPQLAEIHVDGLALGWQRRAGMLHSPVKTFADLLRADQRLQCHLEALLQLGEASRKKFTESMGEALTRGEYFALSSHALTQRDRERIDSCLALARSLPHLHDALLAALEWTGAYSVFEEWVGMLQPEGRLHALATAGWRLQGDPGRIETEYAALRKLEPTAGYIKAGLAWVRGVGDQYMAMAAKSHLEHAQADVRLAAAQTLLLLAEPSARTSGIAVLIALANDDNLPSAMREDALRTIALHAPAHAAPLLGAAWASPPGPLRRTALLARGWIGRISAVPELIACLDTPAEARIAAYAITLITGADPVRDGWSQSAPPLPVVADEDDHLAAVDADRALPWPSASRCADWWASRKNSFDAQTRYLHGLPMTPGKLAHQLRQGPLAVRELAAAHLQRQMHTPPFPTQLPAMRQCQLFYSLPKED